MSGKRDTNDDMVQNSRSSDINELHRLERTKATKEALGFVEKSVEKMEHQISNLSEDAVAISNKASEARRLAVEAQKTADKEHDCFHEQTMANMCSDVQKTKEKVDEWDTLFRNSLISQAKSVANQTKTIIGGAILVSGALVTWLVMFADLSDDVQMLEEISVNERAINEEQEESIDNIKDAMEKKDTQDLRTMVKAFESVMDKREKEKDDKGKKPKIRNNR